MRWYSCRNILKKKVFIVVQPNRVDERAYHNVTWVQLDKQPLGRPINKNNLYPCPPSTLCTIAYNPLRPSFYNTIDPFASRILHEERQVRRLQHLLHTFWYAFLRFGKVGQDVVFHKCLDGPSHDHKVEPYQLSENVQNGRDHDDPKHGALRLWPAVNAP